MGLKSSFLCLVVSGVFVGWICPSCKTSYSATYMSVLKVRPFLPQYGHGFCYSMCTECRYMYLHIQLYVKLLLNDIILAIRQSIYFTSLVTKNPNWLEFISHSAMELLCLLEELYHLFPSQELGEKIQF